ncbi:DUF6157 family protein [Paenibacillus sp. GCM10027626]|uniref:DUF6157 family protein n=1 Tax=Paenibacillus sp. GCM10027626 TaxID=3273411 RepID=UPI00362CA745
MNYYNTFILVSEDCPVEESKAPELNGKKKTVAAYEYEMLKEKPAHYTQDELQFEVHMRHKEIAESDRDEELSKFLAKSRACMRASALPKRYGYGIYFDQEGKAELVPVESDKYKQMQTRKDLQIVKGMRSKRN